MYLIRQLIILCLLIFFIKQPCEANILSNVYDYFRSIACTQMECCDDHSIQKQTFTKNFKLDLKTSLYGQPLAAEILTKTLSDHIENTNPSKALVISFNGWPGTGKNYVAKMIVNNLYRLGFQSKFVHFYVGQIHFTDQELVQYYKRNLYDEIKRSISSCPNQIFIFDEIDKMPLGIFDILKPIVDHYQNIDGINYRHAIFIFLSNAGSNQIAQKAYALLNHGVQREQMKLYHFEQILKLAVFNEQSGLKHSETITNDLIDHYIPFIPLEFEHVELCIRTEFKKRNYTPTKADIEEMMRYVTFGKNNMDIFASNGCKRISNKIATVIQSKHEEF